ncbi:hypothetical protein KC332_g14617 [Hortaea werneckii]|uniref:ER-bound oxygenase mpaB/mpaB'/Rubber oxygenase catalytic domain-containing protein n=1 Tax=Hortaea werneckii EXF-2000 TaxID=1157616 RepID=A0A1Z5SLX4_HORWE|nr:hypothetical protein KC358_g14825 [Hortaea werneckii]OTA20392.1 hypothetical protein BTJ68_15415 [Hortaea werneckii EXF-2000]KAI6805873.1 hypothetical protein KC350_g14408 [Hortaea werneckii]KAI6906504.1 hypothetical protein KC348_g14627 [Hortaea werneckii]KAI6923877.1 hypothetical protein KC341_g14433 [Hortaea werneckii]
MALPNPFRRHTLNTRKCWGYTFELTPDHLTEEQCIPLRQSYDVLGEQVLNRLDEISPPPRKDLPRGNSQFTKPRAEPEESISKQEQERTKPPTRDLYAILQEHKDNNEPLQRFWNEVTTVPEWVDWEQIRRGQDTFYRYGAANLTGLAYQSLLGGMGAARVVETLARTGGFSTKVAKGRLFETTQHILQCTKSVESLRPGGDGFASTIRVRLLHAAVRNRIMGLTRSRPEYYDVEAWGVPINDLDSMGTIATFSASLIWMSLPRQGIFMRRQEIEDYVALWRYIAYLVGCPTEPFASPEGAKACMEALLLYEIHPTDTSKILANNIIKCLADQPPGCPSAEFLSASARWLNGHELSDRLGLMRPSLYYYFLVAGQCIFFAFFNYSNRAVPSWDAKKIEMLKRVFYNLVVNTDFGLKGHESAFEFKYIPEYSTITAMGEADKSDKPATSYTEWQSKKALLYTGAVLVLGGYVAYRVTNYALGLVF